MKCTRWSALAATTDVVRKLDAALGGPPYQVIDWYDLNKQLFTSLYGARRP